MKVAIQPIPMTGPNGATPFVQFIPGDPQIDASNAKPILFRITGPFTGLQIVFEGSFDVSGNFAGPFPIRSLSSVDGSLQSGTISIPDQPSSASPTAQMFYVYPDGGMAVRVRCVALGSGTPVVDGSPTDFFSGPLPTSTQIALATLWQLQHMTFLLSQLDEKLGGLWVPNPLLPSNLLPPAWDENG